VIQDIETTPLRGRRVIWTGSNQDEMREVAGYRFQGVWESMALVASMAGDTTHLPVGWAVQVFENGNWVSGPEVTLSAYTQLRVPQDA